MALLTTLTQSLLNAATAAASHTTDSQRVFGPIAKLWDEYLESKEVRKLPTRLRHPLQVLCKEVLDTANKHFDAFLKGAYPSKAVQQPLPPPSNPTNLPPPPPLPPTTYAQVASSAPANRTLPGRPAARNPPIRRAETRLFLRLDPEHKARAAGGYAMLCALRRELGGQAHLLKEVQTVKTGYALCTGSLEDLTALETHKDRISRMVGAC